MIDIKTVLNNRMTRLSFITLLLSIVVFISMAYAWFTIMIENQVEEVVVQTSSESINIALYRYFDEEKNGYLPTNDDYTAEDGTKFSIGTRELNSETIECYSFIDGNNEFYFDRIRYGNLMNSSKNDGKVIPGDIASFLLVIKSDSSIDSNFNLKFLEVSSTNYGENEKIQNAFKFRINRIFDNNSLGVESNDSINVNNLGVTNNVSVSDYFDSEDGSVLFINNYHLKTVDSGIIYIFFDIIFDGEYEYIVNDTPSTNSNVFSNQTFKIGKLSFTTS